MNHTRKITWRRFKGHLTTVCMHKWYVFKNCYAAGIPMRGLLHDMSKFSPTEFFESVRYFQGDSSPIDACKKENGYSGAWMHHKGRNTHHYEYWQDNFDRGGVPVKMPFRDALELVCDYLGAGMAYQKEKFTYRGEYAWWKNKISRPIAMHIHTKVFVELMLQTMAKEENNHILRKDFAVLLYNKATEIVENGMEKNYLDQVQINRTRE